MTILIWKKYIFFFGFVFKDIYVYLPSYFLRWYNVLNRVIITSFLLCCFNLRYLQLLKWFIILTQGVGVIFIRKRFVLKSPCLLSSIDLYTNDNKKNVIRLIFPEIVKSRTVSTSELNLLVLFLVDFRKSNKTRWLLKSEER